MGGEIQGQMITAVFGSLSVENFCSVTLKTQAFHDIPEDPSQPGKNLTVPRRLWTHQITNKLQCLY